MKLPDWVLNGTTYEDIGKVSDFSMGWNFNTREKARLTGGLCGEGTLSSGGNQTRRRGRMVAFRLLQTSRIDGNMYFLKKRDSLGVCLRL